MTHKSFIREFSVYNEESYQLEAEERGLTAGLLNMDLLLEGETGTGKDTLAKKIHDASGRPGTFVGINCAAIPPELAESQLFGVTNGAYTGATKARAGYVEAANTGTLYLDEVDSMPLPLQVKLLRMLEVRGVERLGTTDFIPLDLRVIASTQHPLDQLVEQGLFRRDLLFRLNMLTIRLPALRQRRELILPLFNQFTLELGTRLNRPIQTLDNSLIQVLLSHSWPGNVRELKSAAKRFLMGFDLLGSEGVGIDPEDCAGGLRSQLRVVERLLIQDALKRHRCQIDAVVEELAIPKRTLYQRMKTLGV